MAVNLGKKIHSLAMIKIARGIFGTVAVWSIILTLVPALKEK